MKIAFAASCVLLIFIKNLFNLWFEGQQWLTNVYFFVEALIVLLLFCAYPIQDRVRDLGIWVSAFNTSYMFMRLIGLWKYDFVGQKYFVPVMTGIIILFYGIQEWRASR